MLAAATVAALLVSGCSWVREWPPADTAYDWNDADPQPPAAPQTRVMQTSDSTWLVPDRTARPVATADELAELAESRKRIAELEHQVEMMRNDLSMMMPAITKLAGGVPAAPPEPMQAYAEPSYAPPPQQQQPPLASPGTLPAVEPKAGGSVMAGEPARAMDPYNQARAEAEYYADEPVSLAPPPAAEPVAPSMVPRSPPRQSSRIAPLMAPVAVPVRPQQPAPAAEMAAYNPAPRPAAGGVSVQGVRFGDHGNKIRLVLDTSGAAPFRYDIDNNEKLLVIELPGVGWNGGPQARSVQDTPLVSGYAAGPDGQGGTRLVFQMTAPGQVLWARAIPPSASQGDRIVLDLAAQ